jgi:hypothetical protein
LSYTTKQGAQFEDTEKGEKGILGKVSALMRTMMLSLPWSRIWNTAFLSMVEEQHCSLI